MELTLLMSNKFLKMKYSVIDNSFDYGEVRYFTLGLLNGRVIAVAHTETDDIIRIIPTRKANKNDQEKYFKKIRN